MPDIQFLMQEPEQVPECSETKAVKRMFDAGIRDSSGILNLSQNSENLRMPAPYEFRVFGARALYIVDCKVFTSSRGSESSSSSLNFLENGVSHERIRSAAATLGRSVEGSDLTGGSSFILVLVRVGPIDDELEEDEDGVQEGG